MKIAIFGGRGFIGKALQERARDVYDTVVFSHAEGDVRHPEAFAQGLMAEKPDAVINLAAILGTLKESPSIQDLFETNVIGNLNVLQSCHSAGVKNVVFISSMTVHGENRVGEHQKRFSPFNPKHGYGASKAAAELSMMQFLKEAPGLKIVTVRPTMVLDGRASLPHAPIEFIKTVLSGKDIEIYGEGLHEREWIWIDDVAEGILKAVTYAVTADSGYHPFFLSAARTSMRDLAARVAEKLSGKVIFAPSTSQAFTLTSDLAESQSLLGWSPENDINDMIEKLIVLLRN